MGAGIFLRKGSSGWLHKIQKTREGCGCPKFLAGYGRGDFSDLWSFPHVFAILAVRSRPVPHGVATLKVRKGALTL